MGQYYKPVILADNKTTVVKWMYSHDYGDGLKLMEHSYITNDFVSTFENQLVDKPQRVAWAGDYADECKRRKTNLYQRCDDNTKIVPSSIRLTEKDFPFVINHSRKEFVDKRKVSEIPNWEGAKIHPLPLLTCEGNNRGGGDFRGDEKDLVGRWSRDLISISKSKPANNYTELIFDLVE